MVDEIVRYEDGAGTFPKSIVTLLAAILKMKFSAESTASRMPMVETLGRSRRISDQVSCPPGEL